MNYASSVFPTGRAQCSVLGIQKGTRHIFALKELTPNGEIFQRPLFVYFMHPSVVGAQSVQAERGVCAVGLGGFLDKPADPMATVATSHLSKALSLSLFMF